MNSFIKAGIATLAVFAVVAGGATAGTTRSQVKITNFVGSYKGTATTQQDGTTVSILANGKGAGTAIGAGTVTGTGTSDSSVQPCPPLAGTGKLAGVNGTLSFKVLSGSKACGDEAGQEFSVVGNVSVTSGTGKLKLAKGTLRFTGSYSRANGDFSVKFTGKLTQPK